MIRDIRGMTYVHCLSPWGTHGGVVPADWRAAWDCVDQQEEEYCTASGDQDSFSNLQPWMHN